MTGEVSPALTYTHALRDARQTGTFRLRVAERRYRRRAAQRTTAAAAGTGPVDYLPGEGTELAAWAAVRRVLGERGVDLPEADQRPGWWRR